MSQILYQLNDNDLAFPSPANALSDPNGLLAIGGDLTVNRLTKAYASGIFPWFSEGDPIMWWSPNPRAIIPTDQIHINKTLKKFLRKMDYRITLNHAFEEVITYCSDAPFRSDETWIVEDMLDAYVNLHQSGSAHSVEVWQGEALVGGLYGVAINGFFSGESMFYKASNASKVALIAIAEQLKTLGVSFIDCQIQNPFLASMGAIEIPRNQFYQHQLVELQREIPQDFWQAREILLAK